MRQISKREKQLLLLLALFVPFVVIYVSTTPKETAVVAPVAGKESIPGAEQRLQRMRQSVALVPGKETVLKQVSAELAEREKNLIDADTGAQAGEKLLAIVRQVARAQAPPVELRSIELGPPKAFGEAYGEVTVSISAECRVDQLVNFMSDISARKEMVATRDLRVSTANQNEKTVAVRLTVAGLVPRRLAPARKDSF